MTRWEASSLPDKALKKHTYTVDFSKAQIYNCLDELCKEPAEYA